MAEKSITVILNSFRDYCFALSGLKIDFLLLLLRCDEMSQKVTDIRSSQLTSKSEISLLKIAGLGRNSPSLLQLLISAPLHSIQIIGNPIITKAGESRRHPHMSKQIMTDTAATDRVVLATPDLQKLINRLNSSIYRYRDEELVETLANCLKGKVSNVKLKTTISTLVSILNDCVDEITSLTEEKCHESTLLQMGDLLFIWLREYRDYIIQHSDWKNITTFYSSWDGSGGFDNKHSEAAEFAIKMILKLHPELKHHKKRRKTQYNRFFSILTLSNKRCQLAHLPSFESTDECRRTIKKSREKLKSGKYEFGSSEDNQTMFNCLDDLQAYYKYDPAKKRIARSITSHPHPIANFSTTAKRALLSNPTPSFPLYPRLLADTSAINKPLNLQRRGIWYGDFPSLGQ